MATPTTPRSPEDWEAAAEQARQRYLDQSRQVTLVFANIGNIVSGLYEPIMAAVDHMYRDHREPGSNWGWVEHELGRTHDWLLRNQKQAEDLRREWLLAKIAAGQDVSDHSRLSAGIAPKSPQKAPSANDQF